MDYGNFTLCIFSVYSILDMYAYSSIEDQRKIYHLLWIENLGYTRLNVSNSPNICKYMHWISQKNKGFYLTSHCYTGLKINFVYFLLGGP